MYQRWLTGPSPCRPSRRDADALELHSTRLWAVCSFARGRVAIFCSFCKANPGNQNRPTDRPAGRPVLAQSQLRRVPEPRSGPLAWLSDSRKAPPSRTPAAVNAATGHGPLRRATGPLRAA